MRLFIVHTDAPRIAGTLNGFRVWESSSGYEALRTRALSEWGKDPARFKSMLDRLAGTGPKSEAGAIEALRELMAVVATEAFDCGYRCGREAAGAVGPGLAHVDGWLLTNSARPGEVPLPFETDAITIHEPLANVVRQLWNAKFLMGAFSKAEDLTSVIAADGGTSRVHVMSTDAARRHFTRFGGGGFENGRYLLHPKRPSVLVPLETFHSNMMTELTSETYRALGVLGARELVVQTEFGVSFDGCVFPLASVSGKCSEKRSLRKTWSSPTYEPDCALEETVWLRDFPAIASLVALRKATDLTKIEQASEFATSFGLDLTIPKIFGIALRWESRSSYRFQVEFFSKRTAG